MKQETTAQSLADVAAIVHGVLCEAVNRTEGLFFSDLEWAVLRIAGEAVAAALILEQRMKLGPLTSEQAEAYASAIKAQNGCFRALGVENPYEMRAH